MLRRRPSKWLLFALPFVAGFLSLWLLEASRLEQPASIARARSVPPTRLVVFWIDALAREEAEERALMPRMHARIARSRALHGPVRACADAVSVPCFTAMITGVDRFSVFALGKNFGGREGALRGSVLEGLQRSGKRIGYLGVPMFKDTLHGLDYLSIEANAPDLPTIDRGLAALDAERLDMVIIHLHETDDIAHRLGPTSAHYRTEISKLDAAVDRAIDRLRPSDHALIMGDHGHTTDGRHFAGLDVPTYAAYFGPALPSTLSRPLAITDHGAIWAQLFGLHFGAFTWVDDYFAGRPVHVPSELPALPSGPATPLWAALLCSLLGFASAASVLSTRPLFARGRRAWTALAALFSVPTLLGAYWMALRPQISFIALGFCALIALGTGALGAALMTPLRARTTRPGDALGLAFAGAVCLALPTVYKYGGVFVALTWLAVGIAALLVRALRQRAWLAAVGIGSLLLPLATIYNPAVRNFSVRWFPVYSETLGSASIYACLACLAAVLWLITDRHPIAQRQLLLAATLGVGCAVFRGVASPLLFALPCAAAAPLCALALRKLELAPLAVAASIPALWFFVEGDAVALAPVAATFVLWAGVPRAARETSPMFRGALLATLIWATFWTAIGCRMTGVTFNFFFSWLPADVPVTRTWAPHALFTLAKYLLLPLLGVLIARLSAGDALASAAGVARSLARLRLGLVIAFMSTFALRSPDAGPFITADIVQELALWLISLFVLAWIPEPTAQAAADGELALDTEDGPVSVALPGE